MWFDPDELLAQQTREIQEVESGRFAGKGHFGAYYALLKGVNARWVLPHSTVNDRIALSYCRELLYILGGRANRIRSVLDVGCGVGAITNAWRELLPQAAATGVDIAEAAITYAKEKYPVCSFLCAGINGETDLGSRFDLVHCKGFFPLIRTDDTAVHLKYLRTCVRHLTPGGVLVLVHPDQGETVNYQIRSGHISHQELYLSKFEVYPTSLWPFRDYLPYRVASRLSPFLARLMKRHAWEVCLASRDL